MTCLQILICSQLQANHLIITQENEEGNNDDPVKYFATTYCCQAIYLNVEAISFVIG